MANRYTDRYQGAPSRPDDDYDHHAPQEPESDPLAELARLIGQADPFAGLNPPASQARPAVAEEPADAPPLPSWMQRMNQRAPTPQSYEPPPEPQHYADDGADHAFDAEDDQHYAQDDRNYVQGDHYAQGDHDPQHAQPHDGGHHQDDLDPSRYDDTLYGAPEAGYAPYAAPPDAYSDPYADDTGYGQQEPVVRQRRGGMATVAAVLALAVVGTAGAYGYRSLVGAPRTGEVPVIKADTGPNKIIPTSQSADAGKQIQDRVSTGQGTERIVSREEQPVDVNANTNAPRPAGPRVVFPPLTSNPNVASVPATPSPPPPVRSAAASGTLGGGGDEPHRVKTLSIRPDQVDGAPQATAPAAPPQARPVAVQRVAAAPTTNAPMSLSPQASPTRVATTAPATAPAAAVASGAYLVQIASQRSETDAQASYRALQAKYPSVLGSHSPLIKRADLGEKGIYYRAMVGPFGTSDEASQFCGSLKSAGGQCVVQRN